MTRIACRVAARTAGTPRRFASWPRIPSGVSPGWMMRAVMPSAQAEALTRKASERVSWWAKSPWPSLSSMSRSAVAASGTRRSASARTMRASPSLVDNEYSRSTSSTPPSPARWERIASMRSRAPASTRRSRSSGSRAPCRRRAAIAASSSAYGASKRATGVTAVSGQGSEPQAMRIRSAFRSRWRMAAG